MVSTRMDGRIDNLERTIEEVQRRQQVAGERLVGIENSLHRVTNERLAGMEEVLNRIFEHMGGKADGDQRNRGGTHTDQEETVNGGGRNDGEEVNDGNKHRKLELPLFEGEDPLGWIFRVERYFSINGVGEDEKLDAAVVSLEGKVLSWFQWMEARNPIRTWKDFKVEVTERFYCKQMGDEYEQLMALKQEGSVQEYREQFEAMTAPLENAPEEVLGELSCTG